jgi:hypothetical protein
MERIYRAFFEAPFFGRELPPEFPVVGGEVICAL